MQSKLSTEHQLAFVLAGNATFTLVDTVINKRHTFKVRLKKDSTDFYFVSVLIGQDNENDYGYIGYIKEGNNFFHGRDKAKASARSVPVILFSSFFSNLPMDNPSPYIEVYHEGHCGRCGRKLTVPESIIDGIGPECKKRFAL
jgi:hypothetical protein